MLNIALVLVVAACVLALASCIGLVLAYRKLQHFAAVYKNFFQGKSGADLESAILGLQERLKKVAEDVQLLSRANRVLADLQQGSTQHVGLVRFNSFADTGGNNSFALALLDGLGNGVVISSLYGRNSMRLYAKPIRAGVALVPLTPEENRAILESRYDATVSSAE